MKGLFFKIIAFLKSPNGGTVAVAFLITLIGIAGSLACVFIGYTGVFSYPVYAVAALSLAYSVYLLARFAPRIKEGCMAWLKKFKFAKDLTEDYHFRTLVFAACSFIINLGFVAFNTVLSVMTGNVWYGSLAGYYFLLSLLRGGVFQGDRRAKKKANGEESAYKILRLKNYRKCGAALFVLDIAMSVAVTFMVLSQKPTQYTEIMAIVFASYSCYKITFAILNIFKAKRTKDLQIQAFRNIGLADAAVSLLSLQTTLVSTFSADGQDMILLNALTGAFVCLLTIGMGVFMIIQANRGLKDEKRKI